MKKCIFLMAAMSLLLSCSDDDGATRIEQEQFFNLEQDNLWVYKKYSTGSSNGTEPVFRGIIDTVRVTGQEVIAGETYYKLNHKYYNSGSLSDEKDEYLRVDNSGHLVDQEGKVLHPGTDFTYQYTHPVEDSNDIVGQMDYELGEVINTDVEGVAYNVHPYVGVFTPDVEGYPGGTSCFWHYQPGIGITQNRMRFVASEDYEEYRLVYYDVN